jgi:hypothetical protein
VQEGQLVLLLPQDEEEGVAKLDELGHVIPPDGVGDLRTVNWIDACLGLQACRISREMITRVGSKDRLIPRTSLQTPAIMHRSTQFQIPENSRLNKEPLREPHV